MQKFDKLVIPKDESMTESMINADLPTEFNEKQKGKAEVEVKVEMDSEEDEATVGSSPA